ncbi:MFS transporter [Bosea thiooxidans]|uniref:MFS transporter n=1 Tax=Bosea thiooxidans TaxID=53254 RepID=A0A0Q3I8F7_9HYPH|nr:MFS transporter [Bosea thiooxidans]KQK31303.1 MFS transporter [Bosea thiooxidans]SKB37586.1 Major Facilitator Superfamily protein [Bosea thiooxidans]
MSAPEATTAPAAAPLPFGLTMPPARALAYMLASVTLAMTQQIGQNIVNTNIYQIQGELGATVAETNWLIAAYMAPNVSLSIALIKIRMQYGLRNFAEISLAGFVFATLLNFFFVHDLQSAVMIRFMSGMAAAPMSSLAFFYMIEPLPPQKRLTVGLSLALTNTTLGIPVTRLLSPWLLDMGGFRSLTLFETGLAMLAFGFVYALPLTTPPRVKVIGPLDAVSYLLIAIGFGSIAVVLALGRIYWWFEAPWLGWLLAGAVLCLMLAAIIELHRDSPLIDIRWLTSPTTLHFAGVLLLMRIVLAEQTVGASNFFQALGIQNEQTAPLYTIILCAIIAGGLTCAALLRPGRENWFYGTALACVALGAWLDSGATSLTRPHDIRLSQALVAYGSGLFLPAAMAQGMGGAIARGPVYILSFITVFLFTQSIGGLLGSAIFGSFITLRTSFHYHVLADHFAMSDPLVAQRISELGGSYGHVLTDLALTRAEGVTLLAQQAVREAGVLAYNDAFMLIALIAALALAGLLLHLAVLRLRARSATAPAPAAG